MNDEKRPEGEAEKLYEQTLKNLLKTPLEKKKDGERVQSKRPKRKSQ